VSEPVRIEVIGYHGAKLPGRVSGKHLWVVLAMFQVEPANSRYYLDGENLLTVEGVGCCWCERPWSEKLAEERCNGSEALMP
jgi:hypothetical protein